MARGKRERQRQRRALGIIQEGTVTATEVRGDLVDLGEAGLRSDGTVPIKVISPGWGSSGFYSAEVLQQAEADRVWPRGTQMYLDHPTATERTDRPERSLRDLAAVTETDAVWRDDPLEGPGLYAESRVFSQWREQVAEMAPHIGVSIRATAESSSGEAEGRKGRIIDRLVEGLSIDFVTKAGRGGAVLAVLEAHRPPASEASLYSDDLRNRLRAALIDRFGEGDGSWCYVRDFNDEQVVFELYGDNVTNPGTFALPYQMQGDDVVLSSDAPTEVKVTTTYSPVTAPTTSQEDNDMPITDEERAAIAAEAATAVITQLTEAGVITTPAADADEASRELAEATQRAERAEGALLVEAARRHVAANEKVKALPAVTASRVVEALANAATAADDGKLDVTKLDEAITASVEAEVKYLAEATGSPVTGAGDGGHPFGGPSAEEAEAQLEDVFKRLGASDTAAKVAVAGRS